MKDYLFVFLYSFSIFFTTSFASNEVTIRGKITNHKEFSDFSTVSTACMDYALGTQVVSASSINEIGEFEVKFNLDFPKNLYFDYGQKIIIIFVTPGHELTINFDANKYLTIEIKNIQSVLKFDGYDKEINKNISKYLTYYNQKFPSPFEKHLKVKNLSLDEYLRYRYELMEDEQEFFYKFISENYVTENLINGLNMKCFTVVLMI